MASTDKKNASSEIIPVDVEVVLTQREKALNAFRHRRKEVETLMKMLAKVTESIKG